MVGDNLCKCFLHLLYTIMCCSSPYFHIEGMIIGANQTRWIYTLLTGVGRMRDLYRHPRVGKQGEREGEGGGGREGVRDGEREE